MIRILLAASLDSRSIELLSEVPEFEIRVMPGLDEERLLEEVRAADALVCPGPLPAIGKLLEAGRDLKLVVQAGAAPARGRRRRASRSGAFPPAPRPAPRPSPP